MSWSICCNCSRLAFCLHLSQSLSLLMQADSHSEHVLKPPPPPPYHLLPPFAPLPPRLPLMNHHHHLGILAMHLLQAGARPKRHTWYTLSWKKELGYNDSMVERLLLWYLDCVFTFISITEDIYSKKPKERISNEFRIHCNVNIVFITCLYCPQGVKNITCSKHLHPGDLDKVQHLLNIVNSRKSPGANSWCML